MAPQLIATKGWSRRGPWSWMARATTSLPVPLSPVTRTVVRVGATFSTSWRTSSMAGEAPRIASPPVRCSPIRWRRTRFSASERPVLERLLHHQLELLHLERLQHVVVRAGLHGLDGGLGGGERGHDDHLRGGRGALHRLEDVEARAAAEAQIGDHEIEGRARQERQRSGRVGLDRHLVPGLGEQDLEQLAHRLLIIDDQDRGHCRDPIPPRAGRRREADVKRVPCPGVESTPTAPPCASTMRCTVGEAEPGAAFRGS